MLKADLPRYDMQMLRRRMDIGNEGIIDMKVTVSLDANTSVSTPSSDCHFFPI